MDNDDITKWHSILPRQLARKTGAAVLIVDHVTKNKESRGRFAIGGQAKLAALDGAAYTCEPVEPLAPGKVGRIELRIGKDRPGGIRSHCSDSRAFDRTQKAADIIMDSTGETIVATIEAPVISEPGRSLDGPQEAMQAVLKALAGADKAMGVNGIHNIVGGRREKVIEAIRYLSCQGLVDYKTGGKGKSSTIIITTNGREMINENFKPVPTSSHRFPEPVACPAQPVPT